MCQKAMNYLQQSFSKSKWTAEEQSCFMEQYERHGTIWSKYTIEEKSGEAIRGFYNRHGKFMIAEKEMKKQLETENQTLNGLNYGLGAPCRPLTAIF